MRGRHEEQEVMLAYVNLEERVPKDHLSAGHQDGGRRGTGTVSHPSSTGCTPGWAGHRCHRSDC